MVNKFAFKKIIILSLIILSLFYGKQAKALLTQNNSIDCPSGTPTEILIYFNGLLTYTGYGLDESLKTFDKELSEIRSSRPGVIGAHYNFDKTGQIPSIITNAKTTCNISSDIPITVAGHSNGGVYLNTVSDFSNIQNIIILSGFYSAPRSGILNSCSKLKVTEDNHSGLITNGNTLIAKCGGTPGFVYKKNRPGDTELFSTLATHFEVRSALSDFYLNNTAAGAAATTSASIIPKPGNIKLLDPLLNLQVKIPGLEDLYKNQTATCSLNSSNQVVCTMPWIAIYIKAIFNYSIAVIGFISVITIMIGGFIWLISAGNKTRITEAKSWIGASLTGVLIALTSYILLNEINPDLIGLKPVELQYIGSTEQTEMSEPLLPSVLGETTGANGVAYFAQTDPAWGKKCYPNQSIHHSGCGLTSLTMVTQYFADLKSITPSKEIRPDTMSECICESKCSQSASSEESSGTKARAEGKCGSSVPLTGQIPKINKCFGVNLQLGASAWGKDNINYETIRKSLREGSKVILTVQGGVTKNCVFSSGGHYIVLTGVNSDGSFNVNDPYPTQKKLKANESDVKNIADGKRAILTTTENYLKNNCASSFFMAVGWQ